MNRYHLDDIVTACTRLGHPRRIETGQPGNIVVTCATCNTVLARTDRRVWDLVDMLNKGAGYE